MKGKRKAEIARLELEYAMKRYDKTKETLESFIMVIEQLKNDDLMDKKITWMNDHYLEPCVKFLSCNGKKNSGKLRLEQNFEDKIRELEFDLASYSIEFQKRLITYFRTLTGEEMMTRIKLYDEWKMAQGWKD